MISSSRYLLIMACSQRKQRTSGLLPALERYDGGNYRLLRKAQREGYWPENLDMLILSAKYGLIEASTPIEDYEQRMDRDRAKELTPQVLQTLKGYTEQNLYSEVYIELGQDYLPAIGTPSELFRNSRVIRGTGRIGERLASLKRWLKQAYEAEEIAGLTIR